MKKLLVLLAGVACGWIALAETASAMPPFRKAFEDKYVKEHPNPAFQDAFKKALCNLCHVPGKPKTVNNAYGEELAKLIEGRANERMKQARDNGDAAAETQRLLEELAAAFAKVEQIKTDPKSSASPTYGERIKRGELPVEVK